MASRSTCELTSARLLSASDRGAPLPGIRDYITPVAYPVPPGLLRATGPNVVAVRVESFGGARPGPPLAPNGSFPGGFYDDPVLQNHDGRTGPFDPAVSCFDWTIVGAK